MRIKKFNTSIIIIGNITVGGTGKTPLLIALGEFLQKNNFKIGIVSRGYKGKNSKPHEVKLTDKSLLVGDEALVIKNNLPGVSLVVSRNRIAGIKYLLANNKIDIVLCDDGLQNYKLHRDLEIVVVDGQRKFGNNFLLPAGPLREPVARLKNVDFVICKDGDLKKYPHFKMQIDINKILNLGNNKIKASLADWQHKTVHAIAGIGNPESFFSLLRKNKIKIIKHIFPDHYFFTSTDIIFNDKLPVFMTEKDAVKCKNFVTNRHWCVKITTKIESEFFEKIISIHANMQNSQ